MPLHGSKLQIDTMYYFDSYFHNIIRTNMSKLDIPELEKRIAKKKDTLKFIDSIYKETFDATCPTNNAYIYDDIFCEKYATFNDYILETISGYENANDEKILYEKSEYFVFETGGYFVESNEGNHRNWIYSFEIETAYNTLKKIIKNLERKLRKNMSGKTI